MGEGKSSGIERVRKIEHLFFCVYRYVCVRAVSVCVYSCECVRA